MGILWYEYVLLAAIFAGTLILFAGMLFGFVRVRVQKWIGGAIGNFMTNLAKQAADEEGSASSTSPSGTLNLGGFKIDSGTIQAGIEIFKTLKEMGILKGGSGGGGSGW